MDNLLEYLVPVIFAAIYFFGNMLSKKSDGEDTPRSEEDADAIERQRRIQEEIRRKIMERRREGEGQGGQMEGRAPARPQSSAPQPESTTADDLLRERRAAVEHRRQQRKQEAQSHRNRHTSEEQREWHPETNTYEAQMQERLQQIEATKQKAEKLKQQARASRERTPANAPLTTPRTSLARGSVRSTLRNPAAARAAFIYGEVIGPPVSQRKTQTVPGLS